MKKSFLQLAALSGMLIAMSATVNAQWTRNNVTSQTYVTNTGDFVGIGTTNPLFKLDIQSTGITTMSFKSTTDNASILLDRGASNATSSLTYRSQGTNVWQTGIVGNSNYTIRNNGTATVAMFFDYATNNVGIGNTNPANKLSVTGNANFTGNVGIGTTAPAYKLQVVSNGLRTGSFENTITGLNDYVGVYGSCNNTAFYGIGVEGEGGWMGVRGKALLAGSNFNSGVSGEAENGTINCGVYGRATGGTDNWGIYSSGTSYATGTWQSSDAKLKKDVQPVTNAMDKIMQLQPRTYNFKTDEYTYMGLPAEKQYGFIAQEIERVFPELVKAVHQPMGKDKSSGMIDFKAINYTELIPVLTQAMQEQQKQIESQKAEIETLKSMVNSCCETGSGSKVGTTNDSHFGGQGALFQNQPNPFNQTTIIRYALSNDANNGKIIIRDLNGNLVKQVSIAQSGKGQVTINANELAQGTYTYTLEIGGESVDTKLMVVTK